MHVVDLLKVSKNILFVAETHATATIEHWECVHPPISSLDYFETKLSTLNLQTSWYRSFFDE